MIPWKQPGDPWIFYVLAPIVGAIFIAALIVAIPVHWLLILCGFKGGLSHNGEVTNG